jgi:hypothetical protein
MRHTLKESILQRPVHFYLSLGQNYLCRLCSGELFDGRTRARAGNFMLALVASVLDLKFRC